MSVLTDWDCDHRIDLDQLSCYFPGELGGLEDERIGNDWRNLFSTPKVVF